MLITGTSIVPNNTATNTNITTGTDGLYVANVTIQNSSTTGDIVSGDAWEAIQIHACMANNTSSSTWVGVQSGLPKLILFDDLSSDGTNNDTGLDNSHTSDSKSIYIHKSGGKWKLRHTSHGMNYNYTVVFSLVST